jgi:hypothetical protein
MRQGPQQRDWHPRTCSMIPPALTSLFESDDGIFPGRLARPAGGVMPGRTMLQQRNASREANVETPTMLTRQQERTLSEPQFGSQWLRTGPRPRHPPFAQPRTEGSLWLQERPASSSQRSERLRLCCQREGPSRALWLQERPASSSQRFERLHSCFLGWDEAQARQLPPQGTFSRTSPSDRGSRGKPWGRERSSGAT